MFLKGKKSDCGDACHWHPPSVAENVRGQARAIKKKGSRKKRKEKEQPSFQPSFDSRKEEHREQKAWRAAVMREAR